MIGMLLLVFALASQGAPLDKALLDFWSAESESSREKAAAALERLGVDFDTLYHRLESGPRYTKDVDTGLVQESRKGSNGRRF